MSCVFREVAGSGMGRRVVSCCNETRQFSDGSAAACEIFGPTESAQIRNRNAETANDAMGNSDRSAVRSAPPNNFSSRIRALWQQLAASRGEETILLKGSPGMLAAAVTAVRRRRKADFECERIGPPPAQSWDRALMNRHGAADGDWVVELATSLARWRQPRVNELLRSVGKRCAARQTKTTGETRPYRTRSPRPLLSRGRLSRGS